MNSSVEVEQEEEKDSELKDLLENTNPLVSPRQANQGDCAAGINDDDCDDDDDDSETIEFEIEVVSNDSSSKQGSLADLRDSESIERNSVAKEDTTLEPVESTIIGTTNDPKSIASDTKSEKLSVIQIQVHGNNQPSQETTNLLKDHDDDGDDSGDSDDSDSDGLEYVLEVIEEDGPSVSMNEQSAVAATSPIEVTFNNNNNNNKNISDEIVPVEIVSQQSESNQEIIENELESEEIPVEAQQIPIVDDSELGGTEKEAQETENEIELEVKVGVEEMILEENLSAQVSADTTTTTIPQQQIEENDNDLKKYPLQSELSETNDTDANDNADIPKPKPLPPQSQESDLVKPIDQSPATEATTTKVVAEAEAEEAAAAAAPPMIAKMKLVSQDSMEPVGSQNIREIYKVLNSDSVLVIGCRPESITETEHQKLDVPTVVTIVDSSSSSSSSSEEAEKKDEVKEVAVEQKAIIEVLAAPEVSLPLIVELEQSVPQSPEITIDHSPDIEMSQLVPPMPRGRRCSIDSTSEDLEWEFDNEPAFEKRDIKVKRGKDPRNEYELGGELGRGKFGTVYRCLHRESGRNLAAKFVLTRRKEDRDDVEREVEIMSLLQHKRLLQLYDAFDNGTNEMCLITELVEGGELFERIIDDDFDLTERKAAIFMRQICEGVEYMHSLNIVHMDMKPENILCISRTGNRIKLIDFGLARLLDPNEALRVMFGTPDFAAPEVLCYDTVSLATDMWSVGVICYVLLSGLSPFMGNNDMETMANVTRATYDFDEAAFDPITDLAKDFISKLLLKDQTKRLKPGECLKHAWLAKGGVQLEAAVYERRKSIAIESQLEQFSANLAGATAAAAMIDEQVHQLLESSITISLDKRNLKKYVVRRKWHKTVHAIMALGRMGAKFKDRLII